MQGGVEPVLVQGSRLTYIVAPKLAGSGPRFVSDLPDSLALSRLSARKVGEDILLSGYVHEP